MKSLRLQTLLYLLLLLLLVGVASYFAGAQVMDNSMRRYEQNVADERFARVRQGVELSLESLQHSASDYAQWDESYNYMLGKDDGYLERNYYASVIENLKISLVFFIKPDGSLHAVVDGRSEEPTFAGPEATDFNDAIELFKSANTQLKAADGYAIRLYQHQPIAMSYASITPSDPDPTATSAGWLVMARILDDDGLASLRKLTGAQIALFPTGMQSPPAAGKVMTATVSDSLGISPVSVTVDFPPSLTQQRNTGHQLLFYNTVIMVVLASLIVIILLDRLILRRLALFSALAEEHLAHTDDKQITWPVKGRDELDTLATSLNNMVDTLRDAERKLRDDQVELVSAKQNLEHANRLKDNFLATVSHELRTPMNGIVGAQELLKTTHQTPYQKECLDTLHDATTHMASMVERILLFSELQSGAIRLKPQQVHVQQWSTLVSRVWALIFDEKRVAFNVRCENIIEPWISIDTVKLDQFVQELLRNAEKFTQNGSVELVLSEAHSDDRWFLTVDIYDTGIGIPHHQLKEVMDSFRQVQTRYARAYGGLGIGLAITREIINALNGTWTLESEEGKGTHIHARIPVEKAAAPPQPVPGPVSKDETPEGPPQSPGRILLVEDNRVNQKIMMKILEMLGWPYQLAENGQEAVDWAQQEAFAMILMDCQMPVMDGLEATKVIRQSANLNQFTPIIAVTANVSDMDRDNCMAVGMNAYLPKPVKPQHINETINNWAQKPPAVDTEKASG